MKDFEKSLKESIIETLCLKNNRENISILSFYIMYFSVFVYEAKTSFLREKFLE